jgi:hypothetical protein
MKKFGQVEVAEGIGTFASTDLAELTDYEKQLDYKVHLLNTDELTWLSPAKVAIKGKEYDTTQDFLNTACQRFGIPPQYAHKIPPDLLLENLKAVTKARFSFQVLLREKDQKAVGVMHPNFEVIDNTEILKTVTELSTAKGLLVKKASLSDNGVYIELLEPAAEIELAGDKFSTGITLSNSYMNAFPLSLNMYLNRLVCVNGAIVPMSIGGYKRGKNFDLTNFLRKLESTLNGRSILDKILQNLLMPFMLGELWSYVSKVQKAFDKDTAYKVFDLQEADVETLRGQIKDHQHYVLYKETEPEYRKIVYDNLSELGRDQVDLHLRRETQLLCGNMLDVKAARKLAVVN